MTGPGVVQIKQDMPGYFSVVGERGQAGVVVGFDELVDWLQLQLAIRGPGCAELLTRVEDLQDEIDELKAKMFEEAPGWDGS